MKFLSIKFLFCIFLFQTTVAFSQNFCHGVPQFIQKFGFNTSDHALNTSNRFVTGLSVLDLTRTDVDKSPVQHESWDDAGSLGHIVRDPYGNCYIIPIPSINTLHNPLEEQNYIYKVDSKTGALKFFMSIQSDYKASSVNPFGMLGLTYDCQYRCLYASSVMGSDRNNERGKIVQINPRTKQVLDTFENVDASGLYTVMLNNKKFLLVGSARTSYIYAIKLDMAGRFIGDKVKIISLDGLGPRGNDIARRIAMNKKGELIITGVPFYFNLMAPGETRQTKYTFMYDKRTNSYLFKGWSY